MSINTIDSGEASGLSRRQFLAGLAGAGVVTIVGTSPVAGAMRAFAVPGSTDNPVLVNVFMRGGADGLNIVVPHEDSDYYRLRGSIAQAKSTLSDLDGFFGLHQSFASLYPLYREGELGFIHAVGSKDMTRSHFSAQDNMDLAFGATGWMQRALVAQGAGDALSGLSVGLRTAPSLRGQNGGVAIKRLRPFRQSMAALDFMRPTLESMYGGIEDRLIGATTIQAFTSVDRLEGVSVTPSVEYPASNIARDFKEAAALIKANVGVQMVSINVGGWDHHSDEVPRMATKGTQFAAALAAFKADLGSQSSRVLTLVMSEFGRTAAQNGSGGTDHGHGNMMMVVGGGIAQGGGGKVNLRDNSWVGLSDSDLHGGRDLAITTDFRSVLAEALQSHMAITDDGRIFPGFTPQPLGFLPSGANPPTTTTTAPTTTTTVAATTTTTAPAPTTPTTAAPATAPTTAPTTTAPVTTIPTAPRGQVRGVVSYVDGDPAPNVSIDLFQAIDGARGRFLRSTRTDAAGEYAFTSTAGPHILTFIAPRGDAFAGANEYFQPSVIVTPDQTTSGVNATLLGSARIDGGEISGKISVADGGPAIGIKVDLFAAMGDGTRGTFLRQTTTGRDGSYRFQVLAGCYVLTMIAPTDQLFTNGRAWNQPAVCIDPGETRSDIDARLG